MNPYKTISTRHTSQAEQARPDQAVNSAGGYVFAVDDWQRLTRFLILGSEGGTYYTTEQKLTKDNAGVLLRLAETDGEKMVSIIRDVSFTGRAPKQRPALFALAIAAASTDKATRVAALRAVPDVCRTATHLFEFVGYCEQFRGWGVSLRKAVAGWYEAKTVDQLAHQLIKYRQREGWSHRDLLRLAHPNVTPDVKTLMDFACGRPSDNPTVQAFLELQDATPQRAAVLIDAHRLPWEALPDRLVNEPLIWEALLPTIGQTALLRQLPRLTRIGVLAPMKPSDIPAKLADPERLNAGRVHPMSVLNALATYSAGRSFRGESTWTPVREIVDALDAGFYAAFGAVEPANKRTLLGLDVSGSMGAQIGQTPLTAAGATAAMALVTANTEPAWMSMCFSDTFRPFPLSPRQRIDDVLRDMNGITFGRTDCSQPMLWATDNQIPVDTFVIYTDNETWAGQMHPFQALRRYREKTGIPARLVVQAFTSTGFTIADPNDPGMLDVVGLDAAAPNVVSGFSRGDF